MPTMRRSLSRALTAALPLLLALPAIGVAQERTVPPAAPPAAGAERLIVPGARAVATPEVAASPGPGGPRVVEEDGERYITMDFQDVDLAVLVKFMGEITGKNFVMDDRIQGKVTVISPTRITPDEAYQVFQSVLQVKGFTTIPSGAAIRIIPTADAKQTNLRTLSDGTATLPNQEYVTRLVPLEQVDAADMVPIIQPMVSKDGLLSAYPQTNTLLIIDSAANVGRLARLIAELDVPSSRRQTELITLRHAAASELADTVVSVLDERAAPAAPPAQGQPPRPVGGQVRGFKITPDDRTNTLIVNAAAEQMRQIKELVRSLDVPLPPGSGRINVYYLKYADAEDLLPVLLDIIGDSSSPRPAGQGQQQQQQLGTSDRRRNRQRGSSLRRNFNERTRRQAQPAGQPGQQGQGAIEFVGDVRITADPATNALIISAAPEDYTLLAGVIDKLDIRRRQVYVEATILEVTLDRLRQIGIELQGAANVANGNLIGRTSLANLNPALVDPASLVGALGAFLSEQTVTLPDGTKVPAQVALLTALERDRDVDILSAPNLLTTDNEEAEIIVGQNVPFVASRATSETNLSNTFATVEREDVGITLRLTPQISEGSIVRLSIFEEVSAIIPNPQLDANEVGPTTTVRSASTTITVKDGQTVVIGGLISDSITQTESQVPYISDIPVIGNFFKNTDGTKSKTNLLIFLTPHIIKDEVDAAAVSIAERDRFRALTDTGTPSRVPDPLDSPTFELRDDAAAAAEVDTVEPDGAAALTELTVANVTVERTAGGASIRIPIGTPPMRVAHFALERPGRFVIDVYGRSSPAADVEAIEVTDPLVRRVRVARHRGRMRIVVDLKIDTPPAYVVEEDGGSIVVRLGAARRAAAPPEED
jgi:general secretion pathway protein D